MAKRIFIYIILALGFCFGANASQSNSVRVSLVTIYPGSEIYELYGHTELRVQDEYGDYFFNYGLFDFNAPGFVYRFVKGETDYLCGAIPATYALSGYDGRRVVEQQLNLSQTQAQQVRDLLVENARPENATYRYKFVSDNCATRPRDIIECALGDSLTYHPAASAKLTYRDMMHNYNGNYAWSRFGIDLAFGWVVRVVGCSEGLGEGSDEGLVAPPTPWYATPLFVALVLLALALALTVRDCRRRKVNRWFDTLVFAAYALWGCVIFFLVFVSTHECTSPNYNALWLHPAYLLLVVLPWVAKARKVLTALHIINFVWLTASAVLLATGVLSQELLLSFYVLMAVPMVRSFNYLYIHRLCNHEVVK